jgi:hypothetical protein
MSLCSLPIVFIATIFLFSYNYLYRLLPQPSTEERRKLTLMNVKIICSCRASFEIKDNVNHPKEISCPNCGQPLPDNASTDLLKMFEAFSTLQNKLLHPQSGYTNEQYSIEINHHF